MRDPWPARLATALVWPLGPVAFVVVITLLSCRIRGPCGRSPMLGGRPRVRGLRSSGCVTVKSHVRHNVRVRRPPKKSSPFDRSLVEGPISPAVWKLAWPTMVQNLVAGHAGRDRSRPGRPAARLHRQRRHRRELADLPRRHRLHGVAVHRTGGARGALCRRRRFGSGQSRRAAGVSDRDRDVRA